RSGARFVLLLGEDELAKGVVGVRDMAESQQEEVARDDIGRFLTSRLRP
ncbi:MAG: His/Gly/Thr/Pro-type tRNA ligase C-terminal domain-containing protein, partial [bacterium]